MRFPGTVNEEFIQWFKSLPLDVDGTSKDPRYAPKHRKDKYMDEWRAWCKRFPDKTQWPEYIHTIILEAQRAKAKA